MEMKQITESYITAFFERREDLQFLRGQVLDTVEMLVNAFGSGNKLLLCGNGGSCADCEHIAGELLKGFLLKRPVKQELTEELTRRYGDQGKEIGMKLQQGLPAISLGTHAAAISAFANDVDASLVYAQQVLAYGRQGDILLGISTSGNAENVSAAMMTANSLGLRTIALTGRDGGKLARLAEISLIMPQQETYRIQEEHLAIYHLLCAAVEYELFDC